MPNTLPNAYLPRFLRVLAYIDAHLDEELSVERLCAVAAFSKYHFHRQFSEFLGLGVSRYVQLVRLKRASCRMAFRSHERVIDVALSSGYESSEAFTRAFKRALGQAPSEFREQPDWARWHETFDPLTELRSQYMKPTLEANQVDVVDFPETRVAVFEHRGDPAGIGDSVRRFIAWRKRRHLHPSAYATFNILYDDPHETPAADYRLDLCVAFDRVLGAEDEGIVAKTIPRGECARLRHVGSDDTLSDAITYLYGSWLPTSGRELRDYPLVVQRVRFFPDVPEHEAVLDIYLPLR